ncbi:peptidoglycan-binding protein [Devosia pacifica]|uniref:Peptidoglycan-binding protein n=1 Tax=Devosia pacifica TaxID=1335967 RepID=A0A918VXE5_9HYPH|nr:peptidoglycan-binding protein [Devosia pacifica]GHA31346.1 peptidoglycan-binding protein [Devosia pacifica]
MARAYSASTASDAYASEWQALRGELVALLDKVEGRYGNETGSDDREYDGLARRVRDLREQVVSTEPGNRKREALQSVKRAVDRFNDRDERTERDDDLHSAIAQIRSRQGPQPAAARVSSVNGAQLVELTGLVSGIGKRLERLEGEIKTRSGDSAQLRDVGGQVEQLAQVVELLAGAVGETGQVKRLEMQIGALTDMVQTQSGADLEMLNRRLDEVSATIDKLAELQMQQMQREVAREERAAESPDQGALMRDIESGMRSVYDRIDAIERNVGLSQGDLDRLTGEMSALTGMMQDQQLQPDEIMARFDLLQQDVAGLSGGNADLGELREDLAALRGSIARTLEPRFERIEEQLGAIGEHLADGRDDGGIRRIEAQLSDLMARMDETGAQLGTLSRLYADTAEASAPDYSALADLVAERTSQAVQKASRASHDDEVLTRIERRLSDMSQRAEERPDTSAAASALNFDQDALADLVALRTSEAVGKSLPVVEERHVPDTAAMDEMEQRLVTRLDTAGRETAERLARLEETLRRRSEAAPSKPAAAQAPIDEASEHTIYSDIPTAGVEPDLQRDDDQPGDDQLDKAAAAQVEDISAKDDTRDLEAMFAALAQDREETDTSSRIVDDEDDRMPSSPDEDTPLVDLSFSPARSPEPAPPAAPREPLPAVPTAAQTESAAEKERPQFDPTSVERPPRPVSSLGLDDGEDPFVVPSSAPAAATQSAPATSQSTFIAAARKAQRSKQASADANANSVIGRALARVRPGSDQQPAPESAPAPAEAQDEPAPSRRGLFKRGKKAEPASDKSQEPNAAKPHEEAHDEDAAEPGFLTKHRRPLLLAAALVAVSALALNLAMQRMTPEAGAPTAPAATAPATTTEAPALDEPAPANNDATDVSTLTAPDDTAAFSPPTSSGSADNLVIGPQSLETASRFERPALESQQVLPELPAGTDLADVSAGLQPAGSFPATPVEEDGITTSAIPEATSPVEFDLPPEPIGPDVMRQAAAQGDARAQFEVAAIYTEGQAVQQDYAAAATWYERSAAQGFVPAQYRLGNLYETGNGVEPDLTVAKLWYQRAAEAGNRMAMHNLAAVYAGGELGEQDFDSAATWFERAARQGMTDSQFNLGMLYARGLGVEQNLETSYKWFSIAAANGDPDAAQARDDIARSLGAEAVAQIGAEVAGFEPEPIDIAANFAPIGTWSKSFDPGDTIVNADVIGKVQAALNKLGYEAGRPDGLMGPQTREAISAFEADAGMSTSGSVNPRLLAVLGSQPV